MDDLVRVQELSNLLMVIVFFSVFGLPHSDERLWSFELPLKSPGGLTFSVI